MNPTNLHEILTDPWFIFFGIIWVFFVTLMAYGHINEHITRRRLDNQFPETDDFFAKTTEYRNEI